MSAQREEPEDVIVNEDEPPRMTFDRLPSPSSGFRTFDAQRLFVCSPGQDDAESKNAREEALAFFADQGYLVLDNIVTQAEIDHALKQFELYMQTAAGIDVHNPRHLYKDYRGDIAPAPPAAAVAVRAKPKGDGNEAEGEPKPEEGTLLPPSNVADPLVGCVTKKSAGQSAMNWFLRSRPNVQAAFRMTLGQLEKEWAAKAKKDAPNDAETMKLMTSFDGMNYFRNPEVPGAESNCGGTAQPWFHIDAGDEVTSHYCQGLVNLVDCTDENDAGLILLPESHKTVFPLMCPQQQRFPPCYVTNVGRYERQISELNLPQRAFRVPLKAGSMALWSSKVLHCNTGCLPRSTPNPNQLIRRVVSYISMLRDPKDPKLTEQRKKLFENGRTTTHQPDFYRWVGDVSAEAIAAKAVIVKVEDLPVGAAELL